MTNKERIRRIKKLIRRMEKRNAENRFDSQEVLRLIAELEQGTGRPCSAARGSTNGHEPLDPNGGLHHVQIRNEPGLGTYVTFDNAPFDMELRNRKMIEALLIELAARESLVNGAANGFVPFKTKQELIDGLERRTEHKINELILRNHVRRLRRLMIEADVPGTFIETGGGGYRLRLLTEGRLVRLLLDGSIEEF